MNLKVNQLKVGVILSYLSKIIQITVGIVYTPIMIRLLGQSEYGLYNIAVSIISYLGVLNLGFGSAYIRFYLRIKEENDRNKVASLNGMFLAIFVVLGIMAVIAGMILAFNVDLIFGKNLSTGELEKIRILILILVVNLAFTFFTIVFTTYIQANEKFIVQNLIAIISQITTPLISLPLLLSGYGSIGMVLGMSFVSTCLNFMTIYYTIKKLNMKISFSNFDKKLFKEMSSFSFFIFINMIVDQINNNLDKTILGRYQGTVAVAIYSVGSNLNTYYTQISTSISSVFIPRVHRMEASNVGKIEISELFIKVGRIQFIFLSLISSGFIFFGRAFINLWVGSAYIDSFYVAMILMLSILVSLIQNLGIEIQRAKNKHQFRSYLYIVMAIGNFIISIPLSQRFGAVGAALGTAISYIFGNGLIMNWYYYKGIGLNIPKFWKEIASFIPSFIIPFMFGLIINYIKIIDGLYSLFIFGSIYIGLFIISIWFLGLNSYEKNIFKSPFK